MQSCALAAQQQHRALLKHPPTDSVEPESSRVKHIHPDCLNAHFYHVGDIHKGKQGSSNCISSRDNVFYHNDSYNTKSNLSAFFSDLKSNSSALSLYLIRICCKVLALKMRVKSIRKNPMKFLSLSLICCRHEQSAFLHLNCKSKGWGLLVPLKISGFQR